MPNTSTATAVHRDTPARQPASKKKLHLHNKHGGLVFYGAAIRILNIGVGTNCIYPLIGHGDYVWSFVGSDTDGISLSCAQAVIVAWTCLNERQQHIWHNTRRGESGRG